MFKHYLTTALRHFRQHKIATGINIACLSLGIACFLVVYVVVQYLSRSDLSFAHSDRIYALTMQFEVGRGDMVTPKVPRTSAAIAKYVKADIPELAAVARASVGEETQVTSGIDKMVLYASYADPEFLDVFALTFLQGAGADSLRRPHSAVISQEAATKLFGSDAKAIGRELLLPYDQTVTITGVIGAIQQPSHMSGAMGMQQRFDLLVSLDVLEAQARIDSRLNYPFLYWGNINFYTYALLPANGSMDAAELNRRLAGLASRHAPKDIATYHFGAVPISEVKMTLADIGVGTQKTGLSSTAVLYLLGALVLLIACLNYANLATAQASVRAKEVGMRRVVGATRKQIAAQYFMEATLLTLIALACTLALLAVLLPLLPLPGVGNIIANLAITSVLWIGIIALVAFVSLTAGAYPAFVLSAVRPIHAVRAGRSKSGPRFVPTLLTGVQFTAASFLVVAILVMSAQNREMQRMALAGDADPVVVLGNNLKAAGVDLEALRTELVRQPHVKSVTARDEKPWQLTPCNSDMFTASEAPGAASWPVCRYFIAHDFFKTYDIALLAGRVFDRDHANDLMSPNSTPGTAMPNAVIDRALAEQYGWHSPEAAVGQVIRELNFNDINAPLLPFRVIGVVEHHPLEVVGIGATSGVYLLRPDQAVSPSVRISASDVLAAINEIQLVWNRLAPRVDLKWQFTDALMNETQKTFGLISGIFNIVCVFALVVAVLGLVGMSFHVIRRRLHEIGVRKTLGANVRQILVLLLSDFSRPVIIANIIAWPIALVAMNVYLRLFTQRVSLSIVPFALSLGLTLLIAWLAVSFQATRAARMNPATVLRHE